ncbi:MAG: hypothetical protein ACOYUZ_05155 [Patescibacteria group bacterium]
MKNILALALFALALTGVLVFASQADPVEAVTLPTFKFKFDIQKLKLRGITSFTFNRSLMIKSFKNCSEISGLCEQEYLKCRGLISSFDQDSDEILLKAKNACIYSCEGAPDHCFGLDLAQGKIAKPETYTPPQQAPKPEPKTCAGPSERDCTTATGAPGTQTAASCDTTTGNWSFGECKATFNFKTCSGPTTRSCVIDGVPGTQKASVCDPYSGEYVWGQCLVQTNYCTSYTYSAWSACKDGKQTRSITSSSPAGCIPLDATTSQSCEVVCETKQPQCPAGYSGSYVCQNGEWVNKCQAPSSKCPKLQQDWRVCVMSDGRYGREYTDYCNESTGEWVWRVCNVYPNLQPECTAFTYTDWTKCSGGSQGRTILTRSPYGCAGGNPITTQSCSVTCTSFEYSKWTACSGGSQTRTVISSSPAGCTGGSPVTYQTCCDAPQPSCPSSWTGSYTCSNNYWYNTCVPPGASLCYRGVTYKNVTEKSGVKAYAKCVGIGYNENGKFCLYNTCPNLQQWNEYGSEANFKNYVDTIYSNTVPSSCNPKFQYTQCK